MAAEADSPMGMVSVLIGLTYLARWEGRHQDAVRLAGAADALREQVSGRAPLDFVARFLSDPEAEARARLSADVAQRAWEEGRRGGRGRRPGLPDPGPLSFRRQRPGPVRTTACR